MQIPMDYETYIRNYVPEFVALLKIMEQGGEDAVAQHPLYGHVVQQFPRTMLMLSTVLTSRWCNGDAYALSRELQDEFAEAEIPHDLEKFDVECPSEVFWLSLPDCPLQLCGGERMGRLTIHGLYVIDQLSLGKKMPFVEVDDAGLLFVVWAGPKDVKRNPTDDLFYTFGVPASAFRDVESYLVRLREQPERSDFDIYTGKYLHDQKSVEDRELEARMRDEISRYVINLLLHLNMPREHFAKRVVNEGKERRRLLTAAKRKGPKKAKRDRQRAERMSTYSYIVLEPDEEHRSELKRADRDTSAGRKGHWRRAHYRRVWVGSKTSADGSPQKGERTELRKIGRSWVSGTAGDDRTHTRVVVKRRP